MSIVEPISYLDRLPFESAIDLIESLPLDEGVDRYDLIDQVKQTSGEDMVWWVDHTMRLLREHGYVRRIHLDVDHILYMSTENWTNRDLILSSLRSPPKKNRIMRDLKRKLARQERERSARSYSFA